MSDNEKPSACECCDFMTSDLEPFSYQKPEKKDRGMKWLCNICSNTIAGNTVEYASSYEVSDVMRMLAYCTNLILSKREAEKK